MNSRPQTQSAIIVDEVCCDDTNRGGAQRCRTSHGAGAAAACGNARLVAHRKKLSVQIVKGRTASTLISKMGGVEDYGGSAIESRENWFRHPAVETNTLGLNIQF